MIQYIYPVIVEGLQDMSHINTNFAVHKGTAENTPRERDSIYGQNRKNQKIMRGKTNPYDRLQNDGH